MGIINLIIHKHKNHQTCKRIINAKMSDQLPLLVTRGVRTKAVHFISEMSDADSATLNKIWSLGGRKYD